MKEMRKKVEKEKKGKIVADAVGFPRFILGLLDHFIHHPKLNTLT